MQPEKGSPYINIPVTFDNSGGSRVKQAGVKLWLFITFVIWLMTSIVGLVVADSFLGYLTPLWALIFFSYIVRFIILREKFYRAKRRDLIANDFKFDHTIFWNIYDISYRTPYFVTFETGTRGLFVAFDKGVVIGKGSDSSFYHHEALMDAYQQVLNKNIEMIHIDYMDVVGKDNRMDSLFELAQNTKNEDIRRVLMRMFDHMEYLMNSAYSSYDVYAFYYAGREDQFWFELEQCLGYFKNANYLRYRILDRDQISSLVESTMNLDEFSVNRANDAVFRKLGTLTTYLRPIWVEKDGERKVLNKTLDEIKESKRVAQAEKRVKKKGNIFTRNKRDAQEDNFDLFDTDSDSKDAQLPPPEPNKESNKTPNLSKTNGTSKEADEDKFDLFD